MSITKQIANPYNLHLAWEKIKWFYRPGDVLFDEMEVARFESNLFFELESISNDVLLGNYNLSPISPIPFPKSKNDKGSRIRQTFSISIRDQICWQAVVNIIGPLLDVKMPHWSYGNRLYISAFYDYDEFIGSRELKFGYYRNTTKYSYRKWTQSWPLYRRHINLVSKFMALNQTEFSASLGISEQETIERNDSLSKKHPYKSGYLDYSYWSGTKKSNNIYWASVDIEKFYQTSSVEIIRETILKSIDEKLQSEIFKNLIINLFSFKIDFGRIDDSTLQEMQLSREEETYEFIPTGLFVAGFLSNAYLLRIDSSIERKLKNNRNIAHFRYVDDHVFLSTSFEELEAWITLFQRELEKFSKFTSFNKSKTEPKELADYLNKSATKEEAKKSCEFNPTESNPLMTQTLKKVSTLAKTDFDLLTREEESTIYNEFENLLLTDFPDQELRKDTRISFASTMLSRFTPNMSQYNENLYALEKERITLTNDSNKNSKEIKSKIELVNDKLNEIKSKLYTE